MKAKKISKTKLLVGVAAVVLIALIAVFLLSGKNFEVFKSFFRKDITREEIRETARGLGIKGVISVALLAMLQIIFVFLPAEPVQVIAGVSYGLGFGIAICMVGVFIGNTVIYILYKVFGKRIGEFYSSKIDIDWNSAKTFRIIALIIFILYFLPAIPYGMICFFAASTGIKYPKYIGITLLGSLPSVVIGVGLGDLAIQTSLIWAAVIFVILLAVVIVVVIKRDKIVKKLNAYIKKKSKPYSSDTQVRKPNKPLYRTFVFFSNIFLAFKLRLKCRRSVKIPEGPSIVLVTHGCFIDFMFVLKYLIKCYPHIVTARMYFYHKFMGNMMRKGGIIPKSMFTADFECARNCFRVLKSGEVLLMMPEARLSTVGRFEGIQDVTSKFLYTAGVKLYIMKLHGNYFARPKWGNGIRSGSTVECEIDELYTPEELKEMDYDTFKKKLDEAMYYDEYEWLETRPKLKYKSKKLAQGLEGILYKCPQCGHELCTQTKGRKIFCTHCGMEAELDDRYAFLGQKPFKDIRYWWDYQYDCLVNEIKNDPDCFIQAEVELKHSSLDGKKCLRHAGEGVCRLDANGLVYSGTDDGKETEVRFSGGEIYRILFGVNEDFEIYSGKEIYFFVPRDKRECAKWYLVSTALKDYFKS